MEYFQLVRTVPKLLENVISRAPNAGAKLPALQNLIEERQHVEPWVRFARALGVSERELVSHRADRLTASAISDLMKLTESSYEEAVAAMYAYEKQLPAISSSKIEGMKRYYGLGGGDSTRYFEIHEEADLRHSEVWRNVLRILPREKERKALLATIGSLRAQNGLLDSVYAQIFAE
jgi:pyrroloquinoline-quinone synthase